LIQELFEEVATEVDALICGGLELKSEPKELFTIIFMLTLLIELC
jgi:hypothetical protein